MPSTQDKPSADAKAGGPVKHFHGVIWLDHHEARIIHFNATDSDELTVRPEHPPRHLHIKSGSASGTHITEEPAFYRDVAKECEAVSAILLTGPSTAKGEFVKYLAKHSPQTSSHIWGVETLAQVTDPHLLAEARRFFAGADRMHP